MRIAYLVSQYPAPSHTFIRREIEALRALGANISTYSIRPPQDVEVVSPADIAERASTYYVLPARPREILLSLLWALRRPLAFLAALRVAVGHRVPGIKAFFWALFHFVEAMQLARVMHKAGIEHVHNHFANAAANVGFILSHYLAIPHSLTLHGISEFDYPAGPVLPPKLEHAAFVNCISHFTFAQAARMTPPRNWEKMQIVRCGLDLEGVPEPASPGGERLRFICVGRMSPEKGQIGLLRAFARAKEKGLNAELLLIGDGPDLQHVRDEIKLLGLSGDCTMLGRQPDTRVLIEVARCDIFVQSSFMEGLPVVLMEAFAVQVPVIAPAVAGIPELVDEHCGITFPASDWAALERAILRLASLSAQERAAMGAEGRRRIEAEFEIHRAIEPLVPKFVPQAKPLATPALEH